MALPSATLLAQSVLSGVFIGALYGLLGLGLSLSLGPAAPDQPGALRVRVPRRLPLLPARGGGAGRSARSRSRSSCRLLRARRGAALVLRALLGDAVQLAARHFRPHRHHRGGNPVDLDRRLPRMEIARTRRCSFKLGAALPAAARADHARLRRSRWRSASWAVLRYTDLGKALRATAEDAPIAAAFGVNEKLLGYLLSRRLRGARRRRRRVPRAELHARAVADLRLDRRGVRGGDARRPGPRRSVRWSPASSSA